MFTEGNGSHASVEGTGAQSRVGTSFQTRGMYRDIRR